MEPEDLINYGLIPELVGRLPVISPLTDLDREALIRILKEPKNALIKQYAKMFELEGINLKFEPEALEAVADTALKRGSGARGLRAVLEDAMLELMYEAPSRKDIDEVVITRKVIDNKEEPIFSLKSRAQRKPA